MDRTRESQQGSISRRQLLQGLGTAAAFVSTPHILRVSQAHAEAGHGQTFAHGRDRFGRLFPQLAPFAEPSSPLEAALLELGKSGGILDAHDPLEQGPILLITDPALSANNPNNPAHTAGTTFVGQFIDHDITFDLTSRLGQPTRPERSPNERTPALDLDSVYGGEPDDDPELYQQEGPSASGRRRHATKFKIESGGLFEDLPRNSTGRAIIADPRNDEHLMIAGLQAAFLLFHNRAVDHVASSHPRTPPGQVFKRARQLTTWHYQWMVLHEFLPLFIGQALVDDILTNGRQFYTPQQAIIPVEFQGAAYRFGHSMVRPSYRANLAGDNGQPFFGLIFDPTQQGIADPADLRGGFRAPRRFVGWQTFFDFGDGNMRPNKRVDTRISTPLFQLPLSTIATPGGPISLPQRNLLRHVTWQLPSGQRIAQHLGVPALSAADLQELQGLGQHLNTSTPLWYYILKEAEVMADGLHLGPVGGRIVGEVLIGLLQLDRHSFLSASPAWHPTLPTRNGQVTGDFRMVDFLTFAGVDPVSRGQ